MPKTYNRIQEEPELNIPKLIGFGVLIAFVLILAAGAIYTIQGTERGVLLTWGKVTPVAIEPGLHFKTPIAQEIIKFSVQTQKYETQASAASKDLQIVTANIAVNYHLEPTDIPKLFSDTGASYEIKVIQPLVQDTVKAVTAQFTAEELITKRPEVAVAIEQKLREKLRAYSINVEATSITNFDFSKSFNDAIEAKVTAEQNALAAKNKLEQVKFEAEQAAAQGRGERDAAIARAEGEAAKVKLVREELERSPAYIEYIRAQRWDGKYPAYYLSFGGSGSGIVPLLNIPTFAQANSTQ